MSCKERVRTRRDRRSLYRPCTASFDPKLSNKVSCDAKMLNLIPTAFFGQRDVACKQLHEVVRTSLRVTTRSELGLSQLLQIVKFRIAPDDSRHFCCEIGPNSPLLPKGNFSRQCQFNRRSEPRSCNQLKLRVDSCGSFAHALQPKMTLLAFDRQFRVHSQPIVLDNQRKIARVRDVQFQSRATRVLVRVVDGFIPDPINLMCDYRMHRHYFAVHGESAFLETVEFTLL